MRKGTLIHSANYPSFNNFTSGLIGGYAGMASSVAAGGWAWFGYSTQNTSTTSGLLQSSSGTLLLNAPNGQGIYLGVGINTGIEISSSAVSLDIATICKSTLQVKSTLLESYDVMTSSGNISNVTNITFCQQSSQIDTNLINGTPAGMIKTVANVGTGATNVIVHWVAGVNNTTQSITAYFAYSWVSNGTYWSFLRA